ncbi:hypothetical protein GCM10009605_39530 [Nocardiopsis composta]
MYPFSAVQPVASAVSAASTQAAMMASTPPRPVRRTCAPVDGAAERAGRPVRSGRPAGGRCGRFPEAAGGVDGLGRERVRRRGGGGVKKGPRGSSGLSVLREPMAVRSLM